MKEVPLFILTGFLESGKTTIIKEIIENNKNYQNNSTIVISCEEGEVEYDDDWCKKYKVRVEAVTDEEEFGPILLDKLYKKYKPKQFVIEYNSFYDWSSFATPKNMAIYQKITLIDASTFQVMFNNMRQIYQKMCADSGLIIFNRCENVQEKLGSFRRAIRGLNQQAQIAFEMEDGRLTAMLDEDLPYDLSKDEINFEKDVYATWYMDVFDNYKKYFNKTFKFSAYVRDITEHTLVIGRKVMTCCANDIQFFGYEVMNTTTTRPKLNDLVYMEVEVTRQYSHIACEEVVMLVAKKISILPYEEEEVLQ